MRPGAWKMLKYLFSRRTEHANPAAVANQQLNGIISVKKFERRAPHPCNAIELFEGAWARPLLEYPGVREGDLSRVVNSDPRPQMAADHLGLSRGSLNGFKILELGPLEGFDTWQLLKLGADHVTAVESNTSAYLKCLIVKELFHLQNCRFLLGDCLEFLEETAESYDMIYCSGVLYHMIDPYQLIRAISAHTSRVFVWTHYCHLDNKKRQREVVTRGELQLTYFPHPYLDTVDIPKFWGGNQPMSNWLCKQDIVRIFESFGFSCSILDEVEDPDLPSIFMVATR